MQSSSEYGFNVACLETSMAKLYLHSLLYSLNNKLKLFQTHQLNVFLVAWLSTVENRSCSINTSPQEMHTQNCICQSFFLFLSFFPYMT